MEDRDLFNLREALRRHISPAWRILSAALVDNGVSLMDRVAHVIVPEATICVESDRACPHTAVRQGMRCRPSRRAFTSADYILANSRGELGAIFGTPMSPRRKEPFTPDSYRHFVRYFLSMPPILTVGQPCNTPLADYPVQYCMAHRTQILDAAACHAAACTSASSARTRKHNKIVRALEQMARDAGLVARREPPTSSLLGNEFSPDDCRSIFPSKSSAEYKRAFAELCAAIARLDAPGGDVEAKQAELQRVAERMPPVDPSDLKGLRVDLAMTDEVSGEAQWIDVSVINTATPTYATAEVAFITAQRQMAMHAPPSSEAPRLVSPALIAGEIKKNGKYSRLMMIANRAATAGKRPDRPVFTPVLFSACGEAAKGASEILDWIA